MYRVYFLFKLILFWYNVLKWGVALRAFQNTQMVITKSVVKKGRSVGKCLCAVPYAEGDAIRCVCCVTWSASRMGGHHWKYTVLICPIVDWCNPFNILQSAFGTPRVTPVYMVTCLTSFTVILQDRAGCSQACTWRRWTSNYSAFWKLLTIL